MIPTLQDVADRSGYSLFTVQAAFRDKSRRGHEVSLKTGLKIMKAAEDLGLRPWHIRRGKK